MDIRFTHNPEPTVGIELELHVVDPDTGDLASAANEILDAIGAPHPEGTHPKAKHELFQSTIEIITGICKTPAEGKADLQVTLDEVRTEAASRSLQVMSAGTHPFARCADQLISPNPRYHDLVDQMQWPARRLLICGAHFHVGVENGEQAIAVINELQRHLPLFLILSASSPYMETEDTGLASARSKVFESLPTAGLPPMLDDWHDFEIFMQTLLTAECISSIQEVWWDVRPHPDFGTVELRMCDAPSTLRETTALAALAQALVADAADRFNRGQLPPPPREWVIRENRWLAARHGVDADLIVDTQGRREPARDVLERLVDDLRPAADRIGSTAELNDVLELWSIGPSYLRQRRMIESGHSLRDVVSELVEQLETDEPR